jgi:hypothetical protein
MATAIPTDKPKMFMNEENLSRIKFRQAILKKFFSMVKVLFGA